MTIYRIEADGEIIAETADQLLAEAMFDAAQMTYDVVAMYREEVSGTLH